VSDGTTHHKIEVWEIDKIIPYEANAKKHPKEQVEKLAKAITKFGWTQPIVIAGNGEIIAGHGRRLAAIHLGLTRVPVICRRDLTKAEADALRLADNRVTSTEYDQSLIQDELQRLHEELSTMNIDLTDLGFDQKEIDFTMADLSGMDDAFFVDDITEAVETQKNENAQKIESTDETAAPVVDALGFKRVTIAQSRMIRDGMLKIESSTGKKGVEALIDYLSRA
jgi:hypothetical protein